MGWNALFAQSHSSHCAGGSKTLPTVPFVKIDSPHSPTETWEFLRLTDTHRPGGSCGCLQMGHPKCVMAAGHRHPRRGAV